MGDRDKNQNMDENWQDDKTRLLARKAGKKKTSLLREAINAVDAALGSDRKKHPQDSGSSYSNHGALPVPERQGLPEIEFQSSQEIIEQALVEMKSENDGVYSPVPNVEDIEEAAPFAPHMNTEPEDVSVMSDTNFHNNPANQPHPTQGAVDPGRTQRIRVTSKGERPEFHQEPVVAWLVVVQGPGMGAYRAIYEGNNAIGRAPTQHVQLDFGDDAISAEEQAFIRYDPQDRSYLFIPNLAKTNVVSLNEDKPTGAVPLKAMDIISMGKTRMAFVPFCGEEFDWSDV